MGVYNPRARGKLTKLQKTQPCDGCGCACPKGSKVLLWRVWRDGYQHKVRFCDRCARALGECDALHPVDFDLWYMVRDVCERCDSFPFCEMVGYIREHPPMEEVYFGGLDLPDVEGD